MKSKNYSNAVFTVLAGLTGSLVIGIIIHGTDIFNYAHPTFQFVEAGLAGALFFAFFKYGSPKEQVVLFFLVILLDVILIGKSIRMPLIIRDFIFTLGLWISVKLYFNFLKNYPKVTLFLRSFALALFYGISNMIAGLIVYYINTGGHLPSVYALVIYSSYGVLIGLGIALGIDGYNFTTSNLKPAKKPPKKRKR